MQTYFVYLITNAQKTVLYTGVTNDLTTRLRQHYENRGKPETFAGRYYCFHLVYSEQYSRVGDAITREKEIKGWTRSKKEALVATTNPTWAFLQN